MQSAEEIFCEWWPMGATPCYAPAEFVLVRPGGEMLRFTCALHAPAWAAQVKGLHHLLKRADWEALGSGYHGTHLGG
jgi:hypothetical protein